ncbi:MAG: ribonuclease [Desulfobulbaceae bacterium A2]|nr:MAG: ribonuclease [Desulfobulbaceae bacterium A2]
MDTKILINITPYEHRIALVEGGNLIEFHVERPAEKGLVGNIYRGRVVRVLPGMQAAFVDIGLERTGFLYVDDVRTSLAELEKRLLGFDTHCGNYNAVEIQEAPDQRAAGQNIEDLLTEGQDILVQICKDPIGSKGARLTCHITLPCRYLVLMPLTDHIGVSRKIENEEIRLALREKIERLRPPQAGFIVRTAAEGADEAELEADMEFLLLLWDEIRAQSGRVTVPSLVHEDLDIVHRTARDLFTEAVERLIIDDTVIYEHLMHFVHIFSPRMHDRVQLYQKDVPLFEAHGIEVDINRALERKVWLRSGGYIIIEKTEALTVIDVNTGRYVGKNDLAETIFKTNMEAVKEIAYQLRLRNIGGLIIIDFIDMEIPENREELFMSLQESVRADKCRTNILKLSEFGLVQMTRKRTCESLEQMLCEPCHYCAGSGILKSRRSICYEIFRRLSRDAGRIGGESVTLRVHPQVADMLLKDEHQNVQYLEEKCGKRFAIVPAKDLHIEKYDIIWNA